MPAWIPVDDSRSWRCSSGPSIVFNLLVRDRNRVAQGWSDVDVQLKRRHDLVPRLVEVVKGYAGYERALLSSLAELRTRGARRNASRRARRRRDVRRAAACSKLVALVESYPDLKASANFLDLQQRARRHREPDPVRAPLLQRRGESLQQPHPALSGPADRERRSGSATRSCSNSSDAQEGRGARGGPVVRRCMRGFGVALLACFAAAAPGARRRAHPVLRQHDHRRARWHARSARDDPRARGGRRHPARHLPRLPDHLPAAATAGRSSSASRSMGASSAMASPSTGASEARGNGVRIYLGNPQRQ